MKNAHSPLHAAMHHISQPKRALSLSGAVTFFAQAVTISALIAIPAWAQSPESLTITNQSFAISANNAAYSDVADLVVISPLIVDAQITKLTKVPQTQALGVPANVQRMLVEADVLSLLRGTEGIGGRIRFLLDVPKNAKGKLPKLKKARFFFFGQKVASQPGTIKLAKPNALMEWSAANDALVRAITKEAVQIDAPDAISGVSSAFHTAGTLLGEGETQIFLNQANGKPMTITVTSQGGGAKKWGVATGELVDGSMGAPKSGSLLWYRLACGLPRNLDATLVESPGEESAKAAQSDYRHVVNQLGSCGRTAR